MWYVSMHLSQGGSGSKIVDARETFGTLLEISRYLLFLQFLFQYACAVLSLILK